MTDINEQLPADSSLTEQSTIVHAWENSFRAHSERTERIKAESQKDLLDAADLTYLPARQRSKTSSDTIRNILKSTDHTLVGQGVLLTQVHIPLFASLSPISANPVETVTVAGHNLRDTLSQVDKLSQEIVILTAPYNAARQREQERKALIRIGVIIAIFVLAFLGWKGYQWFSEQMALRTLYNDGIQAVEQGDWETAQSRFSALARQAPDYKDVQTQRLESYYLAAKAAFEEEDWIAAMRALAGLGRLDPNYKDTQALSEEVQAGPDFIFVPAGEFEMGSSQGALHETPIHTIYLDAYWIMRTEVTNEQYSECVLAGACNEPNNTRWNDPGYVDHPVTDVDWQQAADYAAWIGGSLPTEAQWEKACRGTDARIYPWGEKASSADLASYVGNERTTTPVGTYSKGASPYGLLDMSGNVKEWTTDWYNSRYYEASPSFNPTGPASGDSRVVRGGSFFESRNPVDCVGRRVQRPINPARSIGFRMVISGY